MTEETEQDDPLRRLREFVDPFDADRERQLCFENLMRRIIVLSDHAWEQRVTEVSVNRWLDNFVGKAGFSPEVERLHALYLLSQFLYFGVREIRVLLRALFRDQFLIPLIADIRAKNSQTRDEQFIQSEILKELAVTRFLGVGNPSESGVHLLYYFRQENGLTKHNFLDTAQIFTPQNGGRALADPTLTRYIFLDDVCGSGDTAKTYSRNILEELRAQNPTAQIAYHCIFATSEGLGEVRDKTVFGNEAKAIFELDGSYKSLSSESRYLKIRPNEIDPGTLCAVALCYGELVAPGNARGFGDGELLLGFSHNIPDNTLPIIWRDQANHAPVPWTAALRRYMKV